MSHGSNSIARIALACMAVLGTVGGARASVQGFTHMHYDAQLNRVIAVAHTTSGYSEQYYYVPETTLWLDGSNGFSEGSSGTGRPANVTAPAEPGVTYSVLAFHQLHVYYYQQQYWYDAFGFSFQECSPECRANPNCWCVEVVYEPPNRTWYPPMVAALVLLATLDLGSSEEELALASVDFSASPIQQYGFDGTVDPSWKSIQAGSSDTCVATISNNGSGVNFSSASFGVTPANVMGNTPVTMTLTAGTSPTQGSVQAKDANLAIAGTLGVVSYPQTSLKVALRVVHEDDWLSSSGAAVSVDAVRSFLNESVFNQAVFHWTVDMLPPMTVNFDLNGDGRLDTSSQMTTEMQRIVDLCKTGPEYDYNIFLVDRSSTDDGGSMGIGARYGFVHADRLAAEPCSPARVVAHELGHGAFSFPDRTGEGVNIMYSSYYPCENRRHLEKNQWDDIHR